MSDFFNGNYKRIGSVRTGNTESIDKDTLNIINCSMRKKISNCNI